LSIKKEDRIMGIRNRIRFLKNRAMREEDRAGIIEIDGLAPGEGNHGEEEGADILYPLVRWWSKVVFTVSMPWDVPEAT
jgi:hypothetical protein